MRKLTLLFLLAVLFLSLVGCDTKQPTANTSQPEPSSQTLTESQSQPQQEIQQQSQQNVDSAIPSSVQSQNNGQQTQNKTQSQSQTQTITPQKAKTIAFGHAGVNEKSAKGLEVDRDYDQNTVIFEVEFRVNGDRYEYEIHGETGEILTAEKNDVSILTPQNSRLISSEKAKTLALSHANVPQDKVRDLQVELDTEKGIQVYEVEFEYQNYEYHYTVNAQTGKIVTSGKTLD